jgi:hypothetical protein
MPLHLVFSCHVPCYFGLRNIKFYTCFQDRWHSMGYHSKFLAQGRSARCQQTLFGVHPWTKLQGTIQKRALSKPLCFPHVFRKICGDIIVMVNGKTRILYTYICMTIVINYYSYCVYYYYYYLLLLYIYV